jgi:HEAT repeat protein
MALWTAGILLALGLAWFTGTSVGALMETRKAVEFHDWEKDEMERHALGQGNAGVDLEPLPPEKVFGSREKALHRLSWYVSLPDRIAPHKGGAALLLVPFGRAAVPKLIVLLHHSDPKVRERAAEALGDISPAPMEAAPALLNALNDPADRVRMESVNALRSMGPQQPGVVAGLANALKDRYKWTRSSAGRILGDFGPEARSAIPALQEASENGNDPYSAWVAAEALNKIRGEEPPK